MPSGNEATTRFGMPASEPGPTVGAPSASLAAAEDALALVQQQLTLTLDRSYYEADEIESMASQLDYLLTLDTLDPSIEDLVSEE